MKKKILGLLVGGLTLAATASPAMAAKVSVEISGRSVIQAPALVDTAASVSKGGGASCSGAVPATALETAVAGNWDGPAFGVTRIEGEEHQFVLGGSSWAVYVNGQFINDTACDHTLADGDKVLFWWNARDWHDAFFSKNVANYLHEGDALFLWGEGLGCQRLPIHRIAWPPPPGVVPEEGDPGDPAPDEAADT